MKTIQDVIETARESMTVEDTVNDYGEGPAEIDVGGWKTEVYPLHDCPEDASWNRSLSGIFGQGFEAGIRAYCISQGSVYPEKP